MVINREKRERKKSRSDKGTVLITDRDWRVLLWIAEQYAACLDHVQYLLGQEAGKGAKVEGQIGLNAARLVVARWKHAGLADSKKILADDLSWVWLSAKGLRELGLYYKPYIPSVARLEHLHAVNRVRLALEEKYPSYVWFSERDFRADMVYEKGKKIPHIPDGLLETDEGDIALEIELTVKKPLELMEILWELAENYQQVWYFVTDETRVAVEAALKRISSTLAGRIRVFDSW